MRATWNLPLQLNWGGGWRSGSERETSTASTPRRPLAAAVLHTGEAGPGACSCLASTPDRSAHWDRLKRAAPNSSLKYAVRRLFCSCPKWPVRRSEVRGRAAVRCEEGGVRGKAAGWCKLPRRVSCLAREAPRLITTRCRCLQAMPPRPPGGAPPRSPLRPGTAHRRRPCGRG